MITSLRLTNFRSFEELSVEFEPGVNIIVGPNASGKTNLLEALVAACQGKSYKATDEIMIRQGAPWARIEIVLDTNNKRTTKLTREPPAKKFLIDGNEFKRLPVRHKLPVVIFEPNQLINLTSSPEQRRGLVDGLLEQLSVAFSQTRRAYNRTLAQRNNLLKKPSQARKDIFAWNVRLSELAGILVADRLNLLTELNKNLTRTYNQLADATHKLQLQYESSLPTNTYSSAMIKKLETTLTLDIERGFTGVGPHRDDITFLLDGKNLKTNASRGEVRTTLLAFKVNEAQLLHDRYTVAPYLLLDDVFGELDRHRRKTLAAMLKKYQTFITTTDADVVEKQLKGAHLITTK